MPLFNAACVLVFLYGCENWVLIEVLLQKLKIFAQKCYQFILGIRQSDAHMKNDELYIRNALSDQYGNSSENANSGLSDTVLNGKEQQTNIYALYKSEVGRNPVGRPREKNLDQISRNMTAEKRVKLPVNDFVIYRQQHLVVGTRIRIRLWP